MGDDGTEGDRDRAELFVVLGEQRILHGHGDDGTVWIADPGRRLALEAAAAPTVGQVRELVRGRPGAGVLVTDRLADAQREVLDEARWSWWDRRGALRVVTRDTSTLLAPRAVPQPELLQPDPLARPSGREVALHLLRHPGRSWSVRELAEHTALSVGAAGRAVTELTELGLLAHGQVASRRHLFAELGRAWRPVWHTVAGEVGPSGDAALDGLLRLGLPAAAGDGGGGGAGWAVVGTHAVLAFGGDVEVPEAPLRLLVPDDRALAWAVRTHGVDGDGPVEVAAAPARAGATGRRPWGSAGRVPWRLADPLVVALTLAGSADPCDRDVLTSWRPPASVLAARPW